VYVQAKTEVPELRAAVRDLVALSAMPATWIGSGPSEVATGLADALLGLLQLDFAFVRLSDPGGAETVEVVRGSAWTNFQEWLEGQLVRSAPFPHKEIVPDVGDDSGQRRGYVVSVGVNGEGGVVAAASERSDFPTSMDQLLLSVAANHAAAAFQGAGLVQQRRRAEEELRKARTELEIKVVERTAELHKANDELDALRRVATLVAEGVHPEELFAVVAEEVAGVFDVPIVSVVRYETDDTTTECASFSTEGSASFVDRRWPLDGTNVLGLVHRTGEVSRIDDDSQLESALGGAAHESRLRSTVGAPIVVASRVWGSMVVSSTDELLPEGTEARLADFTELLATSIASAESHLALERLAEEQAALRRVATLVAQGVRPAEIFSAVSNEVGQLLGSDHASVARFDPECPTIVIVGVAESLESVVPVGTRWKVDPAEPWGVVSRTARPARVDADVSHAGRPIDATLRRLGLVSTVACPIVVEGSLWGTVTVLSNRETLPHDTEERLEKFSELIATAIANAESKSELAASRRRIVAAADNSRRRIERDLHDGTQQRLVSLSMAVRAAEANVPPDRAELRSDLSRIATELADALEDLQELSRGIHPAILSKGGLGPSLRTLAQRSGIPVTLDVTTDARFPEPIEVAAYFVASETLANAVKHSQASRIELSLGTHNGSLLLSIRDDGIGGANSAHGSGLVGLEDRVEALGGTITVDSPRCGGTSLAVVLPLDPEPLRESDQ
jgi:signal transduction histidine kinase